jgi:zinc protease
MKPSLTLLLSLTLVAGCQTAGDFPTTAEALKDIPTEGRELTPKQWTTDEGSTVLFMRTEELPMLDVRLTFAAGSTRDGDQPGRASLTSALLDDGSEELSVDEIARGFENLGARYSTSSYRDMGVIELRTLSRAKWREPAVELFLDTIAAPTFPKDALERARTQRLQTLRRHQQVPGPQVNKAWYRTLYGDHPYGHPSSGTMASIRAIERADLQQFWSSYYTSGNAVIALVGDIDRNQAESLAARISDRLPAGEAAPELEQAEGLTQRKRKHIEFPSQQTHLLLGNQLIRRGHPDYVPLYVGNHILGGGGFTSILMDEVRQERGYVYGISSGLHVMAAGGPFKVSLQTRNKQAGEALGLTLSLVRDFVADGPTREQLRKARDNIRGNFARSTASNSDIVGQLAAIGFYDLPLDYLEWFRQEVNQTSVSDVKQAFRKHLEPENMAIVSIGPEKPEVKMPAEGEDEQDTE